MFKYVDRMVNHFGVSFARIRMLINDKGDQCKSDFVFSVGTKVVPLLNGEDIHNEAAEYLYIEILNDTNTAQIELAIDAELLGHYIGQMTKEFKLRMLSEMKKQA